MTKVVKKVVIAIRESKRVDVHPYVYNYVMDATMFTKESLVVAMSHLLENKVQGIDFVGMNTAQVCIWLRTFLGEHYSN